MSMTRRSFVTSGLVSGATCLTGTAKAAEATPTIKRAVKYGMVKAAGTMAEKFKLLKSLGYFGVELNSPNSYTRDEVRAAQDASGLAVPGVVNSDHWGKPLSDPNPDVQAACVASVKKSIDDVKAYGGTSVLLVPGVARNGVTYEQCWERAVRNLREHILPYAAEQQIHVLIENVWNDFLTDPKETARFLDELDSPWTGAYFDIGNCVRYSPPETWIPVLGKRIIKLDVKEFGAEKKFSYALGEGDIDWAAVRRELGKLGYAGWATAEMAAGDEAYLRDLGQRMDRCLLGAG